MSKNLISSQNSKAKGSPCLSIVYMVAGLSSRFGGKIKQFEIVGKNGETLIETSMSQAISAGFNEIVFIVGEKTEAPFREKFGNSFRGIPIKYVRQEFNSKERDKPWGTVDALVSAIHVIKGDFCVCNGDDIYGEESFKSTKDFLLDSKNTNLSCALGFAPKNCMPVIGAVNRGVFSVDENGLVFGIKEILGIELNKLEEKGASASSLISMNIFGLRKNALNLLQEKLISFKLSHPLDRKSECYLPVEIGELTKSGKIRMRLIPTKSVWLGITNPGDERVVASALLMEK
ncbi:MAG: sugar phosphate nucleotidyltransferase [Candidatus Diapherotrites archaeon]|nr:sugar phosphate nucleotidyltransferase [Candidatus Diapherotrites archaeon]